VGFARSRILAAAALTVAASCARRGQDSGGATAGRADDTDTFALRIRVSGNGAVVPGGLGRACTDDCTFRALRGKTVELRALGRGDVFHQWSQRCGRDDTCKVKMTGDVDLRAEFGLDRYEPAWAVPFTSSECASLRDVSVGDRVLVAGSFSGTATFGRSSMMSHGDNDAFVAALHPQSGQIDWTAQLGGKSLDEASNVAPFANRHIVAALSISDGATLGSATLTGRQEVITWIDVGDGTIASSAPVTDLVDVVRPLVHGGAVVAAVRSRNATRIARFSSIGGAPTWSNDLAASGSMSASDVAVGPTGDLFVIGEIRGTPGFGGLIPSPTPRGGRPFLARLSGATGSVTNARWLDLDPSHAVVRMASDGHQLIATGTTSESPRRAFVLAMSFEGHTRWTRYYRGLDRGSTVWLQSVVAAPSSAVVAGVVDGELALANRTIGRRRRTTSFLLELSPEGEEIWSYVLPREATNLGTIGRDAEGDLYLAGSFRLPFRFGGKAVAPQPSSKCDGAYLAKLVRTGDRSPRPPPAP
jgi:hypothetical protein